MTRAKTNDDVVVEQVRLLCRALKMPGLAKRLDELTRKADQEAWSCLAIIEDALSTELTSREASSVRQRIREARFPDVLTLDTFDFSLAQGVDKKLVMELARGRFVDEKQNIVLVGPVGTGKTHLATALGIEAARRRQRVTWFRAADLVSTLIEAYFQTGDLAQFQTGACTGRPLAVEFMLIFMGLAARQLHELRAAFLPSEPINRSSLGVREDGRWAMGARRELGRARKSSPSSRRSVR
jgi:hypothetical protein